MSDLVDSAFKFDASWVWFMPVVPLVWLAHFSYRRTRPPVTAGWVTTLWLLRSASVCLVLILLSQPVLSYLARRALHPLVVTLFDVSPSMEVEEGGINRLDRVKRVWNLGLSDYLGSPARAFSSSGYDVSPDTLDRLLVSGQATDLAVALQSAARTVADPRLLSSVVLLSDGRNNLGPDPVRAAAELGIPVHVLGLGSQQTPDDVQLTGVETEASVFAGQSAQLRLRLRNWGFQDSNVVIRIEEGGETLEQRTLQLGAEGQSQEEVLSTPPLAAGPHLLRITVVPSSGELTSQNNQFLLPLRVRQSQLRVLLVSSRPGPEAAFVSRTLAADSTLQVDKFIRRDRQSYYGSEAMPTDLASYEAIILLDSEMLSGTIKSADLRRFVAKGGGLLLQTSSLRDRFLADLLPTMSDPEGLPSGSARDHLDRSLRLEPQAHDHPIARAMLHPGVGDPWEKLPPLTGRVMHVRAKPSAVTLLATSDGVPVVVAGSYDAGRVLHLSGTGFWRQSMFGEGVAADTKTVRSFWRSATHWLAVAEPGGRVRASAREPSYLVGQPVDILVEVFDDLNEPLARATVKLSLTSSGRTVTLHEGVPGTYQTELTGLDSGDFTFRVQAEHGGVNIGQSEGSFFVEGHTVESQDLRADPELLAAIAGASGGQYRELEAWRELSNVLRPKPKLVQQEQRLALEVRDLFWFALLVTLLTAEWLLRRRSGML
jgi:hypothetical protein